MATSIGAARKHPKKTVYDVRIFEETIVTTVSVVDRVIVQWISDVKKGYNHPRFIIGFDVMTCPSSNYIHTLHLCVGRHCLIYRMHLGFVPPTLVVFLSDRDNVFVGPDVKSNLEKFQTQFGIGGDFPYVVLQDLAAVKYCLPELKEAGLQELANILLGKDFEKPQLEATTDWANVELTSEQVLYGSIDPFVSSEIGKALGVANKDPGQQ